MKQTVSSCWNNGKCIFSNVLYTSSNALHRGVDVFILVMFWRGPYATNRQNFIIKLSVKQNLCKHYLEYSFTKFVLNYFLSKQSIQSKI